MADQRRRNGGGGNVVLTAAIAAVGALAGAAAVEHAQARSEGRASLAESAWRWVSQDLLGIEQPHGGGAGSSRRRGQRLSSADVAALPTRTYRDQNIETTTGEKSFCAVCQETFKERDQLLRLPCLHEYHHECIRDYLCSSERPLCPVCRCPVSLDDLAS